MIADKITRSLSRSCISPPRCTSCPPSRWPSPWSWWRRTSWSRCSPRGCCPAGAGTCCCPGAHQPRPGPAHTATKISSSQLEMKSDHRSTRSQRWSPRCCWRQVSHAIKTFGLSLWHERAGVFNMINLGLRVFQSDRQLSLSLTLLSRLRSGAPCLALYWLWLARLSRWYLVNCRETTFHHAPTQQTHQHKPRQHLLNWNLRPQKCQI